jgi:AcrR family transcriptional regulator
MVETSRQRQIEDVASNLFRERGYDGTSVRDIARALDIQGASLYAHVSSKHEVLWSIVDRMATRFEAAADSAVRAARPQPGEPATAAATLDALVRAHVAVVTDDIGRAGVFVHEWRALSDERRAEIADRRDAYEARFRAVIEAGIVDGSFAVVDAVAAAAFILTALNGLVAWYDPAGRLAVGDIADAYSAMALRAVGAGPNDVVADGAHGRDVPLEVPA